MIAIPKNPKGTLTELMQMLPVFYSEVLEMVEIQKLSAEQIDKLIDIAQMIFNDSNIITASEPIIAYYEKIIGIKYSGLRTLEERRRLVLVYYNIFGKVSASKIKKAISYYTGEDVDITFNSKDEEGNYILEINCARGNMNSLYLEDISLLCKKIIPAHLLYKVAILYKFAVIVAFSKKNYKYRYELCGTKPYRVMLSDINSNNAVVQMSNKTYIKDYNYCGTALSGTL